MNRSAWRMAAAAALLLGVVAATQAQQSGKPSKASKPSAGARDHRETDNFRLVKIQLYNLLLAKGKKTCTTETDAVCIIEMQLIPVGGRDYCLAVAPDLKVKTQSIAIANKNIVWQLSHSTLGGKDLAFHGESGIVLIVDPDAQIEKGGPGNGGVFSPPKDIYHVKTKRNKKGAESAYLPVILWGSGGNEELCAAIDPKIVNVD